jgi:hypothetical protein
MMEMYDDSLFSCVHRMCKVKLPQKLIMIHVTAFEALNDHAADRPDSYYKLLPDGQQRTRRSRT